MEIEMTAQEVTSLLEAIADDAAADGMEFTNAEDEACAALIALRNGENPDTVWSHYNSGLYAERSS